MTDLKPGDQAQWNWGSGQPSGTVKEVKENGSLSIESKNGNTVTRNAEPSNPAVHLKQDSGTDVVKRASEVEKMDDGPDDSKKEDKENNEEESKKSDEGHEKLDKPFPRPRQSAPLKRPEDTEQEKEEANLSHAEQKKLAEERDRAAEDKKTNGKTNGHTNGEYKDDSAKPTAAGDEDEMDTREDNEQPAEKEKQGNNEASVGEKRGRDEEPAEPTREQPNTSGTMDGEDADIEDTPAPEPETKKQKVEEADDEKETETADTANADSNEPPKKKAGRPKKEESKPASGERKASIASRTRSKASAEETSV